MALGPADERHLRRAIELARLARENGNQPFGSLLVDASGRIVLEAENTVVTSRDVTGHAELNLVRTAAMQLDADVLNSATPCSRAPSPVRCAPVRSTGPVFRASSSPSPRTRSERW